MKDFSGITARLQRAMQLSNAGSGARAHLDLLQSQIDAIARGDFETLLTHSMADVSLDISAPPEFPWIRTARGVDQLRAALRQNFGSVQDQQPEITNVFAEGDTVILFGRERGRVGDVRYDLQFVEKFTFDDGRLAAVQIIAAHSSL